MTEKNVIKVPNVIEEKETYESYYRIDSEFSSLHCPSCGSANIRVTFKPEFECTYVEEDDSINICGEIEWIDFLCKDCPYWYGTDISAILNLMAEALNLPSEVNIKRIDDETVEIAHLNNMHWSS